ncbi:hypothetical protein ID866_8887, partial [Astraeus odoratus]
MSSPSGDSFKQRSRVLAALDGSALFPGTSDSLAPPAATQVLGKRPIESVIAPRPFPSSTQEDVSVAQVPSLLPRGRNKNNYTVPSASTSATTSEPGPSELRSKLTTSGFALHYNESAPVRRIDVGGMDQEQKIAEFVYNSIENLAEGRSVQEAIRKLGLQSERDVLPGLEVRLLPHQLIGVSWMVDQERVSPHKGGILADEMGLGKSMHHCRMIATMAINLPTDSTKLTLIVVPCALLQQWKEEIETKTNDLFTVHIHHGRNKLMSVADIKSKDIIITTYQTLSTELSVPVDVDEGEELQWLEENGGILSRIKWYRVVLDEAHFIRNRGTLGSRSVALLRANYRWMLTGTPVTNTLADIYGLLRFGRFRPWNDWNDFNHYIAKQQRIDPPLAAMRAQEILKPLLLRRTKDAKLDGKPILQLPRKHINIVKLDFSADEREASPSIQQAIGPVANRFDKIYDSFEKRSRIRINKYIRARTLLKNSTAVLVMILRLRQLCCHPNLILGQLEAVDDEDPALIMSDDKEKERGRAVKVMGPAWVDKIKKRFLAHALANDMFIFSDETDQSDDICPLCKDKQENMRIEREYEVAAAKSYRPCPVCKQMNDLSSQKVFKSSAFKPDREELEEAAHAARHARTSGPSTMKHAVMHDSGDEDDTPPPAKKSRFRGGTPPSDSSDDELPDFSQLFANKEDSDDIESFRGNTSQREPSGKGKEKAITTDDKDTGAPSRAVVATWRKDDYDLQPSTKMLALIDLLREAEAHGDKSICFSQWTSMLDQVEILLSRHGIQSVRYDGQMASSSRDKALAKFRGHDGPRLILVSTKCGGVGLNLVAANRIVNLDLSWNYAVESQAYDRVHRLGQEKEVFINRLVVRDTIEERMLKLQDVKSDLADAALGEGKGVKLHKMSVKEIRAA